MTDLFLYMMDFYGLKEIPGELDEKIIVSFFQDIGFPQIQDDETAWCAAALNACCQRKGYEHPGTLKARDWLNCGQVIMKPKIGDVLIFWRISPDSEWGHVNLFVSHRNGFYYGYGGNQHNRFDISAYPDSHLLGIRRPRKIDVFN